MFGQCFAPRFSGQLQVDRRPNATPIEDDGVTPGGPDPGKGDADFIANVRDRLNLLGRDGGQKAMWVLAEQESPDLVLSVVLLHVQR
jgi:hypothetical protein